MPSPSGYRIKMSTPLSLGFLLFKSYEKRLGDVRDTLKKRRQILENLGSHEDTEITKTSKGVGVPFVGLMTKKVYKTFE